MPEVAGQTLEHARAVVIGGGITGCSVALHLAEAGWTDVVLVEKASLTAGSTCHAAGLVTVFNPSSTMMRFRRYSVELYERLGVFERVGSLRLASSPEQLLELERAASRARGIGLDVGVVSADEARRLMPAISPDSLYGGVYLPVDGHLDPHRTTHAVADAARALGVRIRTGLRVTGIELTARRAIRAVLTEQGRIETELVVDAAGIWAPQVAAMAGGFIPSTPVDHQHIAVRAVPGHELPADMPCFRDPDNLVYGKSEQGGMLFGGYELDPVSRWEDGVPWNHAAQSLPPDFERFRPLMAGAIRRFPFLADAEVVRLVCHPDAMTPDANPLVGPLPGVEGFWVAAGLSLNGFGGGGGIGRALAGWITAGDPGVDIGPYRASRFAETYRDPVFAAGLARETYSDYYRLRYPYDADVAGRPRRLSALHGRLQELGAVFGTKAGWERPDHLDPGRPWRRAERDQAAWGWTRPPWFERVNAEALAVRERAGLIDLSSFGKIAVERTRCARSAPAGGRQQRRSAGRQPDLQPAPRRPGRDRGRRDDQPAGRGALPGRDRGRVGRRWTWPGCAAGSSRATGRSSCATRATSVAVIGLWGPRARADPRGGGRGRRLGCRPCRSAERARSGSAERRSWPPGSATPASSAGSSTSSEPGRPRPGTPCSRPAARPGSNRSATGPSSRSGWRRATATSGPS